MVSVDLLIVALLLLALEILFGRFEIETALWRRFLKLGMVFAITAALMIFIAPLAGYVVLGAVMTLGGVFHFRWCAKHGIHPWTAAPADRYYALRGWSAPEGFTPASDDAPSS